MVRSRVFSCICNEDLLRSDTPDDSVLSASWPAAAPPYRQKAQPPRAPLHKPCWASWEVPLLVLGPTLDYEQYSSGSDTTLGEDDEPLVFSLEETSFDEEEDDEEQENPLYDIHLVGLDDPDQKEVQASGHHMLLLEDDPVNLRMAGQSRSLDASPGPFLLSALAQVATDRSIDSVSLLKVGERAHPLSPRAITTSLDDAVLSSSWPAATAPSRSRLQQPPRAPLRRPSAAPWEVLPLQLPMSPAHLSPAGSPRHTRSRAGSDHSLEKGYGDVLGFASTCPSFEVDEEERLIFGIDNLESEDEEDDEEFPMESTASFLALTSLAMDASNSDIDDIDNDILDEADPPKSAGLAGASPVLLSVLEQVAAEARVSASGAALRTS